MPVGPYNLCAEKAKKSQSICCTSISRCTVDWAPSTNTTAPALWAASIISFTGLTVPSALDAWTMETNFVFELNNFINSSINNSP